MTRATWKGSKTWHASMFYEADSFSLGRFWWVLTKLLCYRFWRRKHTPSIIFLKRHDMPPGTIEARFSWVEWK